MWRWILGLAVCWACNGTGGGSDGGLDSGLDATGDGSSCPYASDPELSPMEAGTIYCGSGQPSCGTGFECCLGGAPDGSNNCQTWDQLTTCTFAVECTQPSDCTANGEPTFNCCLNATAAPTTLPGCDSKNLVLDAGTGTTCQSPGGPCPGGTLEICAQDSDCTPKKCTAFRWFVSTYSYQLGYCN